MRRLSLAATLVVLFIAGPGSAAPTADGKLAFATNGDGVSNRLEIAVANPDGTGFTKLTHHSRTGGEVFWTSNGHSLVFLIQDELTGLATFWSVRPNGTGFQRLPAAWPDDSVSPSGRVIARAGARSLDLLSRSGKRLRHVRLPLSGNEFFEDAPVWSPDGRWIALTTGDDDVTWARVLIVPIQGQGKPRFLSSRKPNRYETAGAWSPDSSWISTTVELGESSRDTLFAVRRDGSTRTRLTTQLSSATRESWSPDSKHLAYVRRRGGIYVVAADGSGSHRVTRAKGRPTKYGPNLPIAWAPRGGLIAYGDPAGLWVVRPNGKGRRLLSRQGAGVQAAWAPSGGRLVFSDGERIFIASTRGRVHAVTTSTVWDDGPQWSADAKQIAFIRGPERFTDPDRISVFTMHADGTGQQRIGTGYSPRWSSGGKLAFVQVAHLDPPQTGRLGRGRILVADGSETPKQAAIGTAPAWSPDGTKIAFMRYTFHQVDHGIGGVTTEPQTSTLLVAAADGSAEREVVSTSSVNGEQPLLYTPAWSPAGTLIAVRAADLDTGESSIWLIDPATGAARLLDAAPNGEVVWSPDGTLLAYGEGHDVKVIRNDGTGRRVVLASKKSELYYEEPAWSPDSTRLAVIRCLEQHDVQNCDVYTAKVDGTAVRRATRTPGVEGAVAWSGSPG